MYKIYMLYFSDLQLQLSHVGRMWELSVCYNYTLLSFIRVDYITNVTQCVGFFFKFCMTKLI